VGGLRPAHGEHDHLGCGEVKLNAPRVAAYESATRALLEQAAALDPTKLDLKHPDGWSPRQAIHHLADSEAQSYARLRRLVAEPLGSIIQGYDEGLWAAHPALQLTRHSQCLRRCVLAHSPCCSTLKMKISRVTENTLSVAGTRSLIGLRVIRNTHWITASRLQRRCAARSSAEHVARLAACSISLGGGAPDARCIARRGE